MRRGKAVSARAVAHAANRVADAEKNLNALRAEAARLRTAHQKETGKSDAEVEAEIQRATSRHSAIQNALAE